MPNDEDVNRAAESGRRVFLARTAMCAGGLFCLGCARALAGDQQPPANAPAESHKFDADSKMTFKQVYGFTFAGNYIPVLKALADDIGREKFLPMLQEAASRTSAEATKKAAPPAPKNTLAAMLVPGGNYFWDHVLSMNWIEKTDKAAELRVTECLWAATFREAGAADIGYASICHPDFAAASAFNPKIRMTRTKTLMQGHECCNHRWVLEA